MGLIQICFCFLFLFFFLQGADRGKGHSDGYYAHKKRFSCERNCGIFAPFSRIRLFPSSQPQIEEITLGERVTYFINNKCHHGMVVDVQEEDGQHYVQISTVSIFLKVLNSIISGLQ